MTRPLVAALVAVALAACGGEDPAAPDPAPAPAPVLSAEALQERLPPAVGPLRREAVATDAQEALGVEVASATARYAAPSGDGVRLTLTDLGTVEMVERMGYGWGLDGAAAADRLDGHPAEVEAGAVRVLVAQRFLVEAEGDLAEAAVRAVDLGALAAAAGP